MKKSIYICGKFIDEQYLWILPIICSFAKEKKIKKLIFEKEINNQIKQHKSLSILQEFEISILEKVSLNQKRFHSMINFFKNINLFFFIFFNLKKEKILSKEINWIKSQYLHGTWDRINLSYNLKNKFLTKIKSIIFGINEVELAKSLIKKNVRYCFLSHTVYEKRFLLAYLREQNVNIFTQAVTNIHRQKKNKDISWGDVDKKLALKFYKKTRIINKYWNNRIKGKGTYIASNIASRNKKNEILNNKNFNVIFLHIFRDSPFNVIDRDRIFVDYFDWFKKTLKILKDSKETWYLKLHPIHKKWGENQKQIILNLLNLEFKKRPKNFLIIDKFPRDILLKNAKRIVTFSGSVGVECVVYNKKPIVISKSILEDYSKNLVYRPKNLSEYSKMLLRINNYKLNNKYLSHLAKTIIYLRENVYSLRKIIKCDEVYRNDSNKIKKNSFNSVYRNLNSINNFLIKKGKDLSKNKTTTLNL